MLLCYAKDATNNQQKGKKMKHQNPYREGSTYHKIFGLMMKKQIFTKSFLVKEACQMGLTLSAALAAVGVMLSSRKNHAGNASCRGDIHFVVALKHKVGEEKRFRLFWRKLNEMLRTQRKAILAKAAKMVKAVKAVKAVKQQKTAAPVTTAPATTTAVTADTAKTEITA